MMTWQEVWRKGFAPVLPLDGLKALAEALAKDDPRLIQGATTTPPPLACVQDWDVEACCAVSYCGWKGEVGLVGEVEMFFARKCYEADQQIGEGCAVRHFINWFDETPRDQMRAELLPEVLAVIAAREDSSSC